MNLVVYAEGSDGSNPGHMVVGQEPDQAWPRYYGFRFDPADLPEEFRSPDKWRSYLFTHAIPGQIVDETRYIEYLFRIAGRTFYEKRAACSKPIESEIPTRDRWWPHAQYSFNPDDFHTDERPCYNCVKWAITIANRLVVEFLPMVRQGRVRLILEHLQRREA